MQVSFMGLLAILFIGLKLAGYITWSWWIVTLPLWGGAALVISLFVIVPAIALVGAFLLDILASLTKSKKK